MNENVVADQTTLLLNCVNLHIEQSAECADLGDFVSARRHRTIADQLLAQLRNAGDVGRRLADAMCGTR
jgi:hypothetical protein